MCGLILSRSSPQLWRFQLLPFIRCETSQETVWLLFVLLNARVFQFNMSEAKSFSHCPYTSPKSKISLLFCESGYRLQHIQEHLSIHSSWKCNLLKCKSKELHFYWVCHLQSSAASPLQGQSISPSEIILRVVCELDCHSASIVTMFDLCPHILLFNDQVVY